MAKVLSLLIGFSFFSLSCSSTSENRKILTLMAGTAAASYLVGQSQSPAGERSEVHGLLWAGIAASTVGAIGLVMSDYSESKKETKIKSLELELSEFRRNSTPQLIDERNSVAEAPIPAEMNKFIKPGKWRRYKLDRWEKDNEQENVWFRQTEMFEFIPPTISE